MGMKWCVVKSEQLAPRIKVIQTNARESESCGGGAVGAYTTVDYAYRQPVSIPRGRSRGSDCCAITSQRQVRLALLFTYNPLDLRMFLTSHVLFILAAMTFS